MLVQNDVKVIPVVLDDESTNKKKRTKKSTVIDG
jgi:hypothetical protein